MSHRPSLDNVPVATSHEVGHGAYAHSGTEAVGKIVYSGSPTPVPLYSLHPHQDILSFEGNLAAFNVSLPYILQTPSSDTDEDA